jgi:hypothetical protein
VYLSHSWNNWLRAESSFFLSVHGGTSKYR